MRRVPIAALVVLTAALAAGATLPASANWLSRLVRGAGEVGEVGGKIGKLGVVELEGAAALVAHLPRLSKGTALAAHVTPEGHWKFVNRDGEMFTAATPDELARVKGVLAPEAAPGESLALYLSEDTVFAGRGSLKDLPGDADLYVVARDGAYRLRPAAGAFGGIAAEFRPGVVVALTDRRLFEETVFRLGRSMNRSDIRVLALEPGGPRRLSSVPRYDPATRAALVDQVEPAALPAALAGLKGQTALVSGRVEGNTLTFRPSSGPEQALDIANLVSAAEAADVNLILVKTSAAFQPGGRNWLWQKVAVAGLDDALERATFADFLSALAGSGSELAVTAAPGSYGRVVLSAVPVPGPTAAVTGTLSEWIGDVTGHVAVKAAEVYARDSDRPRELDVRIVPGLPSAVQFVYLGALVMGFLGWQVSSAWWNRLWPPERRPDYAGRIGYVAARAARGLAFVLLFLPVAGPPAFLWLCVLQVWGVLTLPVRAAGWLRDRFSPRRA
jgi:hypothetical protein